MLVDSEREHAAIGPGGNQIKFVATPGIDAGGKMTVPSSVEVAEDTLLANNGLAAQRLCKAQSETLAHRGPGTE